MNFPLAAATLSPPLIGLGYFGSQLASTLTELGHEVLALDNQEEHINEVLNTRHATQAFCMDTTNIHALQKLGLESFDSVILAIGEDLESSILTALNLIELGVKNLVAKASDFSHGKILKRLGVPRVIYPEADMADRLAKNLTHTNIMETLELDPNYSIIETKAPRSVVGKSLIDARLRLLYGVHVIAIRRDGLFDIVPDPKRTIEKDDILIVIGPNEQLAQFSKS